MRSLAAKLMVPTILSSLLAIALLLDNKLLSTHLGA